VCYNAMEDEETSVDRCNQVLQMYHIYFCDDTGKLVIVQPENTKKGNSPVSKKKR